MQSLSLASRWIILLFLAGLCVLVLTSCKRSHEPSPAVMSPPIEIAPTDFALLPCGPGDSDHPCVLVIAGGKRVLIGAPAGIAAGLSAMDIGQLDALMLFSLRAVDIEGVDEVRNSSWQAGRNAPLLVAGPAGTQKFIQALNLAFETSDALAYIEHGASGGFDAALLRPYDVSYGALDIVMDTGDLQITSVEFPQGRVAYFVNYSGRNVLVLACGGGEAKDLRFRFGIPLDRELACTGDDLTWPLPEEPIFIVGPSAQEDAEAG